MKVCKRQEWSRCAVCREQSHKKGFITAKMNLQTANEGLSERLASQKILDSVSVTDTSKVTAAA